ncbi:eukaryotic translation initiation factor 3 subunit C [Cephus cinctus]|uniref:Eukaryotic translation initiation factor 3 subunit C n=1 Tax=Cephus cinctus TaxID=211228 RepID=A0AAJ7C3P0_CEPCN|nr:eukaryotic translation initiation factor 3 subunit C [Cephus cinctus]
MAKLAIFTCVLFLACISQVFTFPGLNLATGKTQTDGKSISSNVLTSSEESVESESADSSVSEDSDEVSEEDVVDAAVSPVSEDAGDTNNGGIRASMMKLITFLRNLFSFRSSGSSEDNEVSDNSETQVVDDEESSEDTEVEVTVVKTEDIEVSSNPDFIVDSKIIYDEVPDASEVLENWDETSN